MKKQKPRIYILHGWTYSKNKWIPFLSLLKSRGFDVSLLSIPGLTEKIDKPWGIDDYVEWLFGKVRKEKQIILIGHSNGGRIALNFSLRYPEKTLALILIDSAGIYHNDILTQIKRYGFLFLAKIGKKILPFNNARKILYFLAGEKDYISANQNMKKTMVNLLSSDQSLDLNKISTRTLIIWGEKDKITPLSDGKLLNKSIVNSKLSVVNGAGHSPQFTHPNEVINIIINNLVI